MISGTRRLPTTGPAPTCSLINSRSNLRNNPSSLKIPLSSSGVVAHPQHSACAPAKDAAG
jgi:hypothetical protein